MARGRRSCAVLWMLAGSLAGGLYGPWVERAFAATMAPAIRGSSSWDLLVAAEDDPWTVAIAAPVAGKLRLAGQSPLLIAVAHTPTREAEWLVTLAAPRSATVLAPLPPRLRPQSALKKLSPEILKLGVGPIEGSLLVAKRFWKQADEAVVAAVDDAEAVILGSALAASLGEPLLLRDPTDTRTAVSRALAELGVARILVAVSDPQRLPTWAKSRKYASEIVALPALEHRLVAALGPAKIENVVLARAPEDGAGRTAWLAPYLSVVHGAAVVLCRSQSAAVAEAEVAALVRREGLRPRTVTVLGDYISIGCNTVEIEGEDQKTRYTVNTEPCIPREVGRLAEFGVGRIPFESLSDAAVLVARGIVRQQVLAAGESRLLMVSNSGIVRRPLPLCETISRVTAEEVKNFGIRVDEFYGKLADSPEVLTAAKTANLIVYEGHLAYQDLIDVPAPHRAAADLYFDEELDDLEQAVPAAEHRGAIPLEEPPHGAAAARTAPAAPGVNRLQGPLAGLPIVILQSCDSLEEPVLWRIDELGGVAVIGSVTPIHSGSGSALIHAAVEAILCRGSTLGEALRDAQNYMFCVEELKSRRGHKEQAKGRRVAVSFRLWGDPELTVFPAPTGKPAVPPVAAAWSGPDTLTIHVPPKRLPEAQSAKYVAHMVPGSQAAGMVRPREGDPLRRLAPVYFFRLPLPEAFAAADDAVVEPLVGEPTRVCGRVDAEGRWLYLVYYPEQERPGESIVLRLASPRGAGQAGRTSP